MQMYNCTASKDGMRCDITCGSRKAGRYLCYPGRDWNPRLPSCVVPKRADRVGSLPRPEFLTRCRCLNGGTCVEGGRCICPFGTTGASCEAESESAGTDCNLQITGAGAYNCTISSGGTTCDITCDNVLRGRYHCRSGQVWRPQLPYCTTPKGPRTPRQSTCRCENGGSCDNRRRCICPSGFTGSRCENVATVNCPDPGVLTNGYRRFRNGTPSRFSQTYSNEQSIQFFCNQGYRLQGSNEINCLPSGRWSSNLPRCIQIEPTYCSDPGQIPAGSYSSYATSHQYTVGQSVNYYCQNGYGLIGSSVVTCLPSGSWSIKPSCRRVITTSMPSYSGIVCSDPGTTPNGYRRFGNGTPSRYSPTFSIGQSIQFSCNLGYRLQGNSVITCLPSGQWSGNVPRCQRTQTDQKSCQHPGQKPNSRLTTYVRSDQIFPSTTQLAYVCNEGYETGDPLIISCVSGYWSSPPPTCNRLSRSYCTLPEIDATGMIIYSDFDINDRRQTFEPGAEIRFDCEEGYEMDSTEGYEWIIYCKQGGEWTRQPPRCKRISTPQAPTIYCEHPGVDANGIVEDNNGLAIVGQRQVYLPGSELKYRCLEDYEMTGSSSLICTSEGDWSSDIPACRRRTLTGTRMVCPNPIRDSNGDTNSDMVYIPANDPRRRGQGFVAGSQIHFTCKSGYQLIGADSSICLINGQWSSNPPTCTGTQRSLIMCRDPGSLQNGGVIVYYKSRRLNDSDINNARDYPVGTRLSYDCKPGYRLEGERNLICRPNQLWDKRKPVCVEDCGVSTMTAGGKITYGTNTTAGEFPWIVFLFMNETGDTCGGVLLDQRTVLTAAHCLGGASYCMIYFGKYNRSDEYDDAEVKTRTSSELISHADFVPETFDNDIAIIKFSPDIQYSDRIQPICMPSSATAGMNLVEGQRGYVAGWGKNENQVPLTRLMWAYLPVQTSDTCVAAYKSRGLDITITQGMFCAGYANNRINACEGDSGSPMVFYNNQTDRFVVEGLVSHGTGGRCDRPERYTMFTRVSYYLRWINENWR